jgi:threonyl-tRNA synthetase
LERSSSVLSGLTRVQNLQQGDKRIFCTMDYEVGELRIVLVCMTHVYAIFVFPFQLKLSMCLDSYIGKPEG